MIFTADTGCTPAALPSGRRHPGTPSAGPGCAICGLARQPERYLRPGQWVQVARGSL